MQTQDTQAGTAPSDNARTITLDAPLQRAGGAHIDKVQVLKPNSGALRGLNLTDLLQMNTSALHALLPRITSPQITKPDMANLDPADLVALGTAVIGFLVPKDQRADFQTE